MNALQGKKQNADRFWNGGKDEEKKKMHRGEKKSGKQKPAMSVEKPFRNKARDPGNTISQREKKNNGMRLKEEGGKPNKKKKKGTHLQATCQKKRRKRHGRLRDRDKT